MRADTLTATPLGGDPLTRSGLPRRGQVREDDVIDLAKGRLREERSKQPSELRVPPFGHRRERPLKAELGDKVVQLKPQLARLAPCSESRSRRNLKDAARKLDATATASRQVNRKG